MKEQRKTRSFLVTGGAGFIGSNFVVHFLAENPNTKIVNLDKLTYAGNRSNLAGLDDNPHHRFVEGDICDAHLVQGLFEEEDIQGVIHFAAESHVDNSIADPGAFIRTNINGTYTLLETARYFWMEGPGRPKKGFEGARFHHISTDEVFGSLGKTGVFDEHSPYAPNSPYSASKASSDFLVRSYHHTYGLNTVTSNCSNNYGPCQHDEKLIPTIIRKAIENESIPIYGNGSNVRDWLYVKDHCEALSLIFFKGRPGETYMVGGGQERNNLAMAHTICDILDRIHPKTKGSYKELISFVSDRPGHDQRYAVDAAKMRKELGWMSEESLETGLLKTVEWYIEKYKVKA